MAITLTDAAASRLTELLAQQQAGVALRLGVTTSGCSGFAYTMDFADAPGEDDEVTVHSSTQHPSEIQHMVALVLGVPNNAVTVECRRMGGAFGGKETQGNHFACIAALVAKKTSRAAKIRPDRDDDMIITGKRHDFVVDYAAGFDDDGRIRGVEMTYAGRCGYAADLSGPVTDRSLFHADNCYYYDSVRLVSRRLHWSRLADFEVTWAASLSDGLGHLEKGEFDAIVLDLSLPGSEGVATIAGVSALARTIPIVVLTGSDSDQMAMTAIRNGVQDYLVKEGLDGRSLVRAILAAIERQRRNRGGSGSRARA